jgi:YD repeat-containing protein
VLQRLTPEVEKARLYYPNYQRQLPGAKGLVWNYDPTGVGWFVYGLGTVSADGRQLVPDAGVVLQEFTGAMFNGDTPPPPDGGPGDDDDDGCGPNPDEGCPDSAEGGEPVSLITGQFTYKDVDLLLPGVLPIRVGRTYRSFDLNRRMFGVGMTLDYDMDLWSAEEYQEVDLILPTGKRIHYTRFSPGVDYWDAKFITYTRGSWYGSRVEWNYSRGGWDVFFKDGSRWFFGDVAPLQEMADRFGNKIVFTHRDGVWDPITRIDGPNGRWVEFTVNADDVVTAARDSAGRTVSYEYDASYHLVKVTNPNGEAHRFEYNADHRLTRVHSARGDVVLENAYSPDTGVVTGQTLADGSTFSFSYDAPNRTTTITGRSGKTRRVAFNASRRITNSAYLAGAPSEQATSFEYEAAADSPAAITDALGRRRTFTYDGHGNVTSVTRLAGTAEAATTSYTYSADYSQVTSVTDPLGHTTTFTYDAQGNLTATRD